MVCRSMLGARMQAGRQAHTCVHSCVSVPLLSFPFLPSHGGSQPLPHQLPPQPTNQQVESYASQDAPTLLTHLPHVSALLDLLGRQLVLNVSAGGIDRLEAAFGRMVRACAWVLEG